VASGTTGSAGRSGDRSAQRIAPGFSCAGLEGTAAKRRVVEIALSHSSCNRGILDGLRVDKDIVFHAAKADHC